MTYEVGILCHLHMSFYYRGHLLNIPTIEPGIYINRLLESGEML